MARSHETFKKIADFTAESHVMTEGEVVPPGHLSVQPGVLSQVGEALGAASSVKPAYASPIWG